MSTAAIGWARQQRLGPRVKAVLAALALHANKHGLAWPSQAALADDTGLDRKTVTRHIAALEAAGVIVDTGERRGRTGQIKVYRLPLERGILPLPAPKKQSPRGVVLKLAQQRDSLNGGELFPGGDSLKSPHNVTCPTPGSVPGLSGKESRPGDMEEEGKESPSETGTSPAVQVFEAWNAMAKSAGLPTAEKLTPDRRRNLNARLKEHTAAEIVRAVRSIPSSAFLTGGGGRGFKANFDFLLRPGALNRLIEGAYADDADKRADIPFHKLMTEGRA